MMGGLRAEYRFFAVFPALGTALVLAWVSMHFLLIGIGLGITVDEMNGHATQAHLAELKRASFVSVAAFAATATLSGMAIGWALAQVSTRLGPVVRFAGGIISAVCLAYSMTLIVLMTGGVLLVTSLESALSSFVRRI